MAEQICIKINRVTHFTESKPKNWVRLETDMGICAGNMSWIPRNNEVLHLAGNWDVWNGTKQFKFTSAKPDIPIDNKMLLHYVCKIAEGFGEKLEAEIWETLGDDWEGIKPGDVKGVTENRIAKLKEALEYVRLNKSQVDTIAYLLSKGCSFLDAEKAWSKWGVETISRVNDNCYCLTMLEMVGFKKVDAVVRHNFNIADDDIKRLHAGIFYALKQETELDGSTIINGVRLEARCVDELKLSPEKIRQEVVKLINAGSLKLFFASDSITSAKDYDNELKIWDFANATK